MALIDIQRVEVGPRTLTARVRMSEDAPLMTSEDIEGTARVYYLLPHIVDHVCLGDVSEKFRDVMGDTEVAHLLEHVTVELLAQTNIAGDVSTGRTFPVEDDDRAWDIELSCPDDVLVSAALASGAWLLEWAYTGGGDPEPDVEATVAGLVGLVGSLPEPEPQQVAEGEVLVDEFTPLDEDGEAETAHDASAEADEPFDEAYSEAYAEKTDGVEADEAADEPEPETEAESAAEPESAAGPEAEPADDAEAEYDADVESDEPADDVELVSADEPADEPAGEEVSEGDVRLPEEEADEAEEGEAEADELEADEPEADEPEADEAEGEEPAEEPAHTEYELPFDEDEHIPAPRAIR